MHQVFQDLKWPLVVAIWIVSMVLGTIGFYSYSVAAGEDFTKLDLLYRAVQLIAFEFNYLDGPVPWQLEVARFLMPALAAYAAIQALLAIFNRQWQMLMVRFFRNHVVVCGLGERGFCLAQEFLSHGYRVVVIEENTENPLLKRCRKAGVVILFGDATERGLLRRAGVVRAKYLVSVCPDDGTNAEIALKVRDVFCTGKGRALTVFVHMVDLELCNLLKGWELSAKTQSFRIEFFNVFERGARLLLRAHSSFPRMFDAREGMVKIVIIGLGKMGRSLVVQAARDWYMNRERYNNRLWITVIDKTAKSKMELLRLQFPRLERACTLDVQQMGVNDPAFERGEFLYDSKGHCDANVIYICFDDDVHVLVSALRLHQKTRQFKVPIIARMNQAAGLATLIKNERHVLDFEHIHTFCMLDKTCNLEALLGGTQEIIARAIHEDYVFNQKAAGETARSNPSLVDWEDLPVSLKESNQNQAAHIETKLNAIGCGIEPLQDWDAAFFGFQPEEIELLAEMEHERWLDEKRRNNWSYAPKTKNTQRKTSPYLVPWEELSDKARDSDRNMIKNLPSFLARAGFQIHRRTFS